jgi:hypothetical protein
MHHPKPLERAISILRSLDKESYLYMIHRMQPVPLIALANDYNLNVISVEDGGVWHILISPNREIDLNRLLDSSLIKHQEA